MYFITCVERMSEADNFTDLGMVHTIGYFQDKGAADYALSINHRNIRNYDEGIEYEYAVVEKVTSGINQDCLGRWGYRWDDSRKGYSPVDLSNSLDNIGLLCF